MKKKKIQHAITGGLSYDILNDELTYNAAE